MAGREREREKETVVKWRGRVGVCKQSLNVRQEWNSPWDLLGKQDSRGFAGDANKTELFLSAEQMGRPSASPQTWAEPSAF